MRCLGLIIFLVMFFSCENRKVRYSALNDLVVGSHAVLLYENGEFYLELGAGGVEGKYEIKEDRVLLTYNKKPKDWPDELIMTDEYFIANMNTEQRKDNSIWIMRSHNRE
jgi:hypothetical protein